MMKKRLTSWFILLLAVLLLLSACTPTATSSAALTSSTPAATSSTAPSAVSSTVSTAPTVQLTQAPLTADAQLTFCEAAYIDKDGTVHVTPELLNVTDYSAAFNGKAYYDGWKALDGTQNARAIILMQSENFDLHNCCAVVLLADGTLITNDTLLNDAITHFGVFKNIARIFWGGTWDMAAGPDQWTLHAVTQNGTCYKLNLYQYYDASNNYENMGPVPLLETEEQAAYSAVRHHDNDAMWLTKDGVLFDNSGTNGAKKAIDGKFVQFALDDRFYVALRTDGTLLWNKLIYPLGTGLTSPSLRDDLTGRTFARLFSYAPNWAQTTDHELLHLSNNWTISDSAHIVQLYQAAPQRLYALYDDGHVEMIREVYAPFADTMHDLSNGEPSSAFLDDAVNVLLPTAD